MVAQLGRLLRDAGLSAEYKTTVSQWLDGLHHAQPTLLLNKYKSFAHLTDRVVEEFWGKLFDYSVGTAKKKRLCEPLGM